MIYILTQKSNTECNECMSQDIEVVAVRSSLKKGLEAIRKYEDCEFHWRSFELTGYDVDSDPVKSSMIASLDWRINVKRRKPEWKLWIADEYKANWCSGKTK